MRSLVRFWSSSRGVRQRLAGRYAPREEIVRRLAPGRTFADIGCMWNVDGRIAFLAEQSGATSVTGLDIMPATAEYRAEHARRSSPRR